jgi:hypothetical protein
MSENGFVKQWPISENKLELLSKLLRQILPLSLTRFFKSISFVLNTDSQFSVCWHMVSNLTNKKCVCVKTLRSNGKAYVVGSSSSN